MKLKKYLIAASLLATTLTGFSAEKTLLFATEATYPPFVSMAPNGKMMGADADLINAICAEMHAKCKLVNAPWDSLIPSLLIGKYDALFGGMAITPDREKVVAFTEPYYIDEAAVVAPKSENIQFTADGLKGKIIGVQSGTTFAKYMQAKYSDVTVKGYDSDMQALLDLQNGRLNAVFLDAPVGQLWIKDHPHAGLTIAKQIMDPTFFGVGNGIAVQKQNTDLLKQLNHAIDVLKANGTYAKIQAKYFS